MRYAAKIDSNQNEVVNALRKAGASVQSLAALGKGVPDLLVAIRGVNLLMEIKDGNKPKYLMKKKKRLKAQLNKEIHCVNTLKIIYPMRLWLIRLA